MVPQPLGEDLGSVIWENSRCSILFHLLVPGGRCDGQPSLGGECGQLDFPGADAVAVGAAAVAAD
jgi:hypothetical protein